MLGTGREPTGVLSSLYSLSVSERHPAAFWSSGSLNTTTTPPPPTLHRQPEKGGRVFPVCPLFQTDSTGINIGDQTSYPSPNPAPENGLLWLLREATSPPHPCHPLTSHTPNCDHELARSVGHRNAPELRRAQLTYEKPPGNAKSSSGSATFIVVTHGRSSHPLMMKTSNQAQTTELEIPSPLVRANIFIIFLLDRCP